MEIYGERVIPAEEAAKLLGLTVDEFRTKAGWGVGYPAVRGPNGFLELREEHLQEWRRRLNPPKKTEVAKPLPSKTWRGDRFVEGSAVTGSGLLRLPSRWIERALASPRGGTL
jgi:hypothetical protein